MAKAKKQPAKRQVRSQAKNKKQQKSLAARLFENKVRLAVVVLLLVAVPVAAFVNRDNSDNSAPQVQAQEQENQDQEEAAPAQTENQPSDENKEGEQNQETTAAYDYTAQPGDTYSQVARKAIQTYGANNNVNLSHAQIIYAETMLTQEAGSPQLNEGQKVTVKEETVKGWVEKAQKLSDSQEKAWEAYTVGVDFNTDNVGESR